MVLPYGKSPSISFWLFEVSMYVLFALCMVDAKKRGGMWIGYLIGAAGFGLLLEYVNVQYGFNYSYGQFLWMIGDAPAAGELPKNIPVNIGLGWGVIMYSARLFSERLHVAWWSRPAVGALLALGIDLSMDTVAYRLNMWHWGWEYFVPPRPSLTSEWFGVPYGNFFGWLNVVFFFSLFFHILESRKPRWLGRSVWLIAVPTLAVALSEAVLFVNIAYVPSLLPSYGYLLLTIVALVALAIIAFWGARRPDASSTDDPSSLLWLVPAFFHVYFVVWFFVEGYQRESRALTIITLANVVVAAGIHLWQSRRETPAR